MKKFIPKKIFWFGLFISIISIITNLIFFSFSKALGEQYIIPITDPPSVTSPVSVAMIIIVTFLSGLMATVLYSFLNKIAPNAIMPPFLSITVMAFLVSFGGPMELPGTVMQTKILLSLMHIITAIMIIGGFYLYNRNIETHKKHIK